jgi:hypothetical protein
VFIVKNFFGRIPALRRKPGYPLVSFFACGKKRIPLLSLALLKNGFLAVFEL